MERSTAQKFNNVADIYNTSTFQNYYRWAHKACINFLKDFIKNDYKILDVACGTGIFLKKIKKEKTGLQLFGIDNSDKMIAIACQNPEGIDFKVAEAEKIPFTDSSFDLITIIDAFYYFQNKNIVLKECYRVLKPNSYLFLFYPAIDIFPKFVLKYVQFVSRLFFFNLEEYSTFPDIDDFKKLSDALNLKLVAKKIKRLHRFILLQKQ